MEKPKITVGVIRERKKGEGRVGLTPAAVKQLRALGADVVVERRAGLRAGFTANDYRKAGARFVNSPEQVFQEADLVVKVKELLPSEYALLDQFRGKTLFTFLHLSGVPKEHTTALLSRDVTGIAYELVSEKVGGETVYPILHPMSVIAGREAARGAIRYQDEHDVLTQRISIFGVGIAGMAAFTEALVNVRNISVFDRDEHKLAVVRALAAKEGCTHRVRTHLIIDGDITADGLADIADSEIVVSAVMVAGSQAPMVLPEQLLRSLKQGAYVADIAIDQGGSTAWTRGMATAPGKVREQDGVVLSAVPNIPGSTVPTEATEALVATTLPYVVHMVSSAVALASADPRRGIYFALQENTGLRSGVCTYSGKVTNHAVASDHQLFPQYEALESLF